jgi:hypothetical protein
MMLSVMFVSTMISYMCVVWCSAAPHGRLRVDQTQAWWEDTCGRVTTLIDRIITRLLSHQTLHVRIALVHFVGHVLRTCAR